MNEQTIVFSLDELEQVAQKLWGLREQCKVYTFSGMLGAGKTTLVKEILRQAGVKEVTTSPTFTYVNLYKADGKTLYHFDLYRINSLDGFLQQGFDEYLHQPDSWSFVEWPEVIEPLLKKEVCEIKLEYENDKRKLSYQIR